MKGGKMFPTEVGKIPIQRQIYNQPKVKASKYFDLITIFEQGQGLVSLTAMSVPQGGNKQYGFPWEKTNSTVQLYFNIEDMPTQSKESISVLL